MAVGRKERLYRFRFANGARNRLPEMHLKIHLKYIMKGMGGVKQTLLSTNMNLANSFITDLQQTFKIIQKLRFSLQITQNTSTQRSWSPV
jgi:hypothetical protein